MWSDRQIATKGLRRKMPVIKSNRAGASQEARGKSRPAAASPGCAPRLYLLGPRNLRAPRPASSPPGSVSVKPSSYQFSSVQSLSRVWLFATPWIAARQASLSITNSRSSPKLISIESVTPSSHFILCRPLLLLPSIFPSIGVFSNESALCIRWPKYWSFSFSISPSNEHPGLASFRMDWLDLLAVQGTCKNLLQHHSSKASILRRSAFFTVNSHIHTWPLEKP